MLIGICLLLALAINVLLLYRSVVVVAYHGVGPETSSIPGLVVRPNAFRRQLSLLARLGFENRALDAIVRDLIDDKPLRGRTLSITFDDGYSNIVEHAVPILRQLSWTATVFVPTAHIGKMSNWDYAQGFRLLQLLGWQQLEILAAQGNVIGSHGKKHRSLLRMSDADRTIELRDSLAALESRIPGGCSRVFCYPYGHRDSRLVPVLQAAGYIGACSSVHGAFPSKSERYDLGRLVVRSNSLIVFLFDLWTYPIISLLRSARTELGRLIDNR